MIEIPKPNTFDLVLLVVLLVLLMALALYEIWKWVQKRQSIKATYIERTHYKAPKVYDMTHQAPDMSRPLPEPEEVVVPNKMVLGHYGEPVKIGKFVSIKDKKVTDGPCSVLCINESVQKIWTRMEQRSFSIESVVNVLMCNYEVDFKTAYHDSRALLRVLLKYGVVKELK